METKKSLALIGGHIELQQVLGSGGFGKVYHGYDHKKKIHVAVKIIDKELVKRNAIQSYVNREIALLREISNPFVVRLLDVIETNESYNLEMELAAKGELFDKIVDSERFDENTARSYFQQLMCAVKYCHSHNIVHRDLKAENLLLAEDNTLKVCDFGLSRYTKEGRFHDHEVLFTSLAGSIDYQAPEVLKERGYEGSACDMWSCGCILFFMLCGYLPFTDRTDGLTRKRILSCHYNRRNAFLSPAAADLIAHLLERDPETRFKAADVINHPWFRVGLDPGLFPEECLPTTPQSPPMAFDSQRLYSRQSESPSNRASMFISESMNDLRQAFRSCNVTGDGFLNREEVRDALIKLNGRAVLDDEVETFMNYFQLDSEGRITEEEFAIGWTKHHQMLNGKYSIEALANLFHYDLEKEFLMELRKAFDSIDTDRSGLITKEKIKHLGLELSDMEIQNVFDAVDSTSKGIPSLNFEHFVALCLKFDLLKNRPLAIRLRRLENFFAITEQTSFKNYLSTGFTVAGTREAIKATLRAEMDSMQTTFEEGNVFGFLYGSYVVEGKKMLEVGVRLVPAAPGYTKVSAYRIGGKTKDFHNWFLTLRRALKEELLQCEEDTAVKGEPELL